ncbi:mediator of RNA polymerase II transcription subunit 19 isoform X2 [Moschus berezovskii]|uniref:mediator of RNA polymerase II transcription subunit 19 isoform X2 n=1 Tax=Moschus berezovskii TaxID=68408 RepID=UPI0024452ED8|nr:mediator of RNA polymerase II transcription subunit 19 isoform X2 [Moschus berezovskii]
MGKTEHWMDSFRLKDLEKAQSGKKRKEKVLIRKVLGPGASCHDMDHSSATAGMEDNGAEEGSSELTGSTNLITHYSLEHAYHKFCGKKVKEKLSNFLPDLPGMIDLPGSQDNSSLRSLIEKPPILGGSFNPITGTMLAGFRLHTGPLPEQCRLMHIQPPKKKNKQKHKQSRTQDPVPPETPSDSDHKKKKKKKEEDPERKRKKKEKKKKKNRHSPEHPGMGSSQASSSSSLR